MDVPGRALRAPLTKLINLSLTVDQPYLRKLSQNLRGGSELALPLRMPLNAAALDEEDALMMLTWYPEEQWHRLHFAPGIDLDAIKTRAAASKRWP